AERKDTVESEVLRLVEQLAPTRGREVTPAAKLDDLGLDSLAVADLAVAVEERFGVRLVDADVASLQTVGDVVSAAVRSFAPRPRIPPGIARMQRMSKRIGGP